MILGLSFASYKNSSVSTPTHINNINEIELRNAICDYLYVTRNCEYDNEILAWDYDTVLYALFNNNLLAGNLGVALETISSIRIKVRKKDDYDWITIYDIPINTEDDLQIIRTYRYLRSKTNYEIALIPVLNNTIEGNYNITEILSDFEGVFFMEPRSLVRAFLNIQHTQQRNTSGSYVTTIGRKHPFSIKNGAANYDSGTINATFINFTIQNGLYNFDLDNAWIFRKSVEDFLTDGKPKILKTDEGKMWLVHIDSNISQSIEHEQMPIHTIGWTQTGDAEDMVSLYENGFSDVSIDDL